MEKWFWTLLTGATVLWYCVVTFYVAFRGAFDIRQMLDSLKNREDTPET